MSKFAKINNGVVVSVIVAEKDFFETFVDSTPGEWIEADALDDNGKLLRKNQAGIGYTYDQSLDAFIPPKNYDSWIFNNETFDWEAPIPCPTDGAVYRWSEDQKDWVKLQEEIA